MLGPYDDALVYDILHAPGTAAELRTLEKFARRHAPDRARERWHWLEPACGTGRLVRAAAAKGIRCTGYDLSRAMLAFGREQLNPAPPRAPARLVEGDLRTFTLPRRDRATLAFCTINTIRHLPSDAAMLDHLACVRRSLVPGGVYLIGISMAMPGLEGPTEDVWQGRRGSMRVTQVISYLPPQPGTGRASRTERVLSHVIVRAGRVERHIDSSYHLRTYTLDQWERLIARSGWNVVEITDESGRAIDRPTLGYGLWVLTP